MVCLSLPFSLWLTYIHVPFPPLPSPPAHQPCSLNFLTPYDLVQFLGALSLVPLFLFVRSQYLRVEQVPAHHTHTHTHTLHYMYMTFGAFTVVGTALCSSLLTFCIIYYQIRLMLYNLCYLKLVCVDFIYLS